MERFCDELRCERERRKVTIEAICDETKVAPKHVLALEAGDYGVLPGGVFRKGILRSYLKALQLEEETWVARFETSLRDSGAELGTEADWGEFAQNVRRNRGVKARETDLRWVGVALMLVALVVCGWCAWHYVVRRAVVHPANAISTSPIDKRLGA